MSKCKVEDKVKINSNKTKQQSPRDNVDKDNGFEAVYLSLLILMTAFASYEMQNNKTNFLSQKTENKGCNYYDSRRVL